MKSIGVISRWVVPSRQGVLSSNVTRAALSQLNWSSAKAGRMTAVGRTLRALKVAAEIGAAPGHPTFEATGQACRGVGVLLQQVPVGKGRRELPLMQPAGLQPRKIDRDRYRKSGVPQLTDHVEKQIARPWSQHRTAEAPLGLQGAEAQPRWRCRQGEDDLAVVGLTKEERRAGAARAGQSGHLPDRTAAGRIGRPGARRKRVPEGERIIGQMDWIDEEGSQRWRKIIGAHRSMPSRA